MEGGHVLICGPLRGLDILIASLRRHLLRRHQPIIVLDHLHTPEEKEQFEEETPACIVIHGSCKVDADLERAGFRHADRVIVLAEYVSKPGKSNNHPGVERDMSAVLVSMSPAGMDHRTGPLVSLSLHHHCCPIHAPSTLPSLPISFPSSLPPPYPAPDSPSRLPLPTQVISELVDESNIQYLHPLDHVPLALRGEYHLWRHFAAGLVYPSATLDALVCQAYYSQAMLMALEALLPRCDLYELEQDVGTDAEPVDDANADDMQSGSLWQIPLPPCFAGQPFQVVVDSLIQAKTPLLPIGLYRHPRRDLFSSSNTNPTLSRRPSRRGSSHFVVSDRAHTPTHQEVEDSLAHAAAAATATRPQESAFTCAIMCPSQEDARCMNSTSHT